MLRALLIFAALASSIPAQDRWVYLHSDGFELFTNAGDKAGRIELVRLEQFRFVLGRILGNPDLKINPPAQAYLFKTPYSATDSIQMGREHVSLFLSPSSQPAVFQARLAKLLIESNVDRLPAELERGLIALLSTAEVSGIKLTLGKPVPPAQRDKAWAKMHMLAVDPETFGKLRVLFYNLSKGAEEDPAYRNAFGRSKAEIDRDAERYLAAGNFQTAEAPTRPMSVERDFPDKPIPPDDMQPKLAAVNREREQLAEYDKLLAKADTASLERAIEIAPAQAEPRFLLAQRESDPKKRIDLLKVALSLDRRKASYWQALAEANTALHDYPEAAKAWRSAEQAAANPEERSRMQAGRLSVEKQRLDFEEAEKKRVAEENARELKALKDAEIANLRAAEARLNPGGMKSNEKVEPWWNGPQAGGKSVGTLQQVDCLGKQARLLIRGDDGKIVRLVVRDASQIAVVGANQQALGCGKQQPRKIAVEYFPKTDARLGTVGDVATIEFPE